MSKYEYNKDFGVKMDKIVENSAEKAFAVYKQSLQDLVEEASIPVKAGGKMPVRTGFLRLSGTGAINQIPKGESEGQKDAIYQSNPSKSIKPILEELKPTDKFFYGWSARYAIYQEFIHGFLVSACAKWQSFVDKNIRSLKR